MKKVAIMGHGTVGSGVYEVFAMNAARIAQAVGEEAPLSMGISQKQRNTNSMS